MFNVAGGDAVYCSAAGWETPVTHTPPPLPTPTESPYLAHVTQGNLRYITKRMWSSIAELTQPLFLFQRL